MMMRKLVGLILGLLLLASPAIAEKIDGLPISVKITTSINYPDGSVQIEGDIHCPLLARAIFLFGFALLDTQLQLIGAIRRAQRYFNHPRRYRRLCIVADMARGGTVELIQLNSRETGLQQFSQLR